jgi:uncharacterized protein
MLIILCGFAFLAGLVDAVAGGGGLIQLPALLLFLPEPATASIATVFGTNKLSSICGTSVAVVQYARRITIPWGTIAPATVAALLFSWLGARSVSLLNPKLLQPMVLILLILVAFYTYGRKQLGGVHQPRWSGGRERLWAMVTGAVIGFYDGFFGPGTGSFLVFLFIGFFGFSFLAATAGAKVVNFATNLSAVAYFASTQHVLYEYALPMGVCNIAGAMVGTRLAILKGNAFIRRLFMAIVALLILRLAWDLGSGR